MQCFVGKFVPEPIYNQIVSIASPENNIAIPKDAIIEPMDVRTYGENPDGSIIDAVVEQQIAAAVVEGSPNESQLNISDLNYFLNEERTHAAEQQNKELYEQLEYLQKQNQELQKQNQELHARSEYLEAENAHERANAQNRDSELRKHKRENYHLEKANDKLENEINQLQKEINECYSKIQDARVQLNAAELNSKKLEKLRSVLQHSCDQHPMWPPVASKISRDAHYCNEHHCKRKAQAQASDDLHSKDLRKPEDQFKRLCYRGSNCIYRNIASCNFAHSISELTICPSGKWCYKRCGYMIHSNDEKTELYSFISKNNKMEQLCANYDRNHLCENGDKCRKIHFTPLHI